MKLKFFKSFIISIMILNFSCSNNQIKVENPKCIEVSYIGPMDWPVPRIVFYEDTPEFQLNKNDLNILLADNAFNNIDRLSEALVDDISVYSDKTTFSGFKIKNYYNKHSQLKRIKLDLSCDYLKKMVQILEVNEIDTNKINVIKYIDSYICNSGRTNR